MVLHGNSLKLSRLTVIFHQEMLYLRTLNLKISSFSHFTAHSLIAFKLLLLTDEYFISKFGNTSLYLLLTDQSVKLSWVTRLIIILSNPLKMQHISELVDP